MQTAEDRRGDHLRLFGKAMTGGQELIRVGQGLWNARSQAGVWTTAIVVGHPFTKDSSEMGLLGITGACWHCIPTDHREGRLIGTVLVSQNSVPFGHLKFILDMVTQSSVAGSAEGASARQTWRRYQHAFISYASEDRAEVLKRTQMLKLVKVEFFHDLLSLEPGERWAKALYKNIDKSDVFFLFWSTAAKNSE